MADVNQSFSLEYFLDRFLVVPTDRGRGRPLIVTTSHHSVAYPCQVAVLDGTGKVTGEYWHSGHLYHIAASDLNGDGQEEILAAGVNNGYEQGTLVVLDPRRVSGASTQPVGDVHQLKGFGLGAERAVVLFPRTTLNRMLEPFNFVTAFWLAEGNILLTVREKRGYESGYITYSLDRNLNVVSVLPSTGLVKLYREFQASGQVAQDLARDELPRLRGSVVVRRGSGQGLANLAP